MAESHHPSPLQALRAAVNTPYANVVAIVATLSAAGGAVAGGVAALIAAAVRTPSGPVTGFQIAGMALGYGIIAGVSGAALGTLVGFGALRRVPLGRLVLCTNLGLATGLTTGWLGGPWAWHHMGWLGFLGFAAGAMVAARLTPGTTELGSLPSSHARPVNGSQLLNATEAPLLPARSVETTPVVHSDGVRLRSSR